MLRRDRRRARKRSAQAINARRQRGLYASWASMVVALVAILSKAQGANSAFPITIFALFFMIGVAGLMYAHLMWKREHTVLGDSTSADTAPAKRPAKGSRHRAADTHREQVASRGATRIRAE